MADEIKLPPLFSTLTNNKRQEECDLKVANNWYIDLCQKIATEPERFPSIYAQLQEAISIKTKLHERILTFDGRRNNDLLPLSLSFERLLTIIPPEYQRFSYGQDCLVQFKFYVYNVDSKLKAGYFELGCTSSSLQICFVYDPEDPCNKCHHFCCHTCCNIC